MESRFSEKDGGIEVMVHGASADGTGRGEQTGSAYFASGTGDEVCGGRGNLRIAKLSMSSSDRIRMSAGSWTLTRFDGQRSTFNGGNGGGTEKGARDGT